MTPKMIAALADAATAVHTGGLQYTVAGWAREGQAFSYHSFQTVNALADRGLLAFFNKRRCAHITETGQHRLEIERDKLRDLAKRQRGGRRQ